ncbi:hypothetical protein [Candidatus Cyanaurora vandensis]|uniref:hypothetical protein n=1 Tax=Candidatus Cyanaurora vandensis TaxID=2714958 RepID=UPI0025810EF2|nr:hypothetical protein [Candidatus Cyanaurora vandensis]
MSPLERWWDHCQYLAELDPPRFVALVMVSLGFLCFCVGAVLGFWMPLLVLVFNYSLGAGILLVLSEFKNPSQLGWKFAGIAILQLLLNLYGIYQTNLLIHLGIVNLF